MTIHAIDLVGFEPGPDHLDVQIDLRCAAGTYVRSVARDLGERLGSGGYLHALRRTEAAGLAVDQAVTPDMLEALASEGRLSEAVMSVGDLLPLPRIMLGEGEADAFRHGSAGPVAGEDGRVAVFQADDLIGVGSITNGVLQPDKVLPMTTDP